MIEDKYQFLNISRQRKWQLRKEEQGLCIKCGSSSPSKSICDNCAERTGVVKRHPTKHQWHDVDWRLTDKAIAESLNVTTPAVTKRRKRNNT